MLDLTEADVEMISAGVGWKEVLAIGDAVIDFGQGFAKGWNESKAHPLT
ncbi:lactococcin G-beta/enterocin 1071B family bacteriocin [Xanthomonas fragariae]|nr:lactococcin G-beta/enterocin 1071B family bacteriocin [Xanthomonas fragariae]WAT14454.1 lactococcin G-beta/enterocin 1071B family bacteriocin [Xanthomonas fragariae]